MLSGEVPYIVKCIEERVLIAVKIKVFLHTRYVRVLDIRRVEPLQED